jgi:uncharacterized protein
MSKFKILFISLILVGLCSPSILAQETKFPKPRGWVNDHAGILNQSERSLLSALANELERATSAEIAVVTLNTIGTTPIEEYAVDLFEKWGIGKKDKDNGLLILVAVNERQVRIEVGYGLEGVITDGLAGQIIREKIVPEFRQGNFGRGLLAAAATTANLIAKEAGVELRELGSIPRETYHIRQKSALESLLGNLIYFMFLFFIFGGRFFIFPLFFPFFGGGRYWSRGGGGFGGGFGGFGGGLSGGGGASGSW